MAFIDESVGAGQPFYIHLSYYAPHSPVHALDETIEKWQGIEPGTTHTDPAYAAMTEELDTGIGMILDQLGELGVEDNTYVIYTSDHGQTIYNSVNTPLTLGKGTLWEGGMRVPLIVSGPGIEAGTTSDARTVSIDFYPTFAEIAGVTSLPEGLEGGTLMPVLMNAGEAEIERPDEGIVFHFGQPSGQPESTAASSLYLGDYKLLKFYDTGDVLLFNITNDPAEQHNLADQMSDRADDMHAHLTSYLDSVNATIPDPSTARGMGMGMGMGMGN